LLPACGLLEVHNPERYLSNTAIPKWISKRIKVICEGYLGDPEGAALASPLHLIEQADDGLDALPPTLAICGTSDPMLGDTVRLGAVIERHAMNGRVVLYPDVNHAFHAFPGKQSRKAWADQLTFLNTCRAALD
jgi:acetyl esterase/lipase